MGKGIIERYRQFLPVTEKTPIISLGEGGTPLLRAPKLARAIGLKTEELYLKNEGANPTGSFKDRGMVMAVAKALEEGAEILLCASTGNTASSAAAYGAAVGLPVVVLIPKGGVAKGKLAQMHAYGAQVLEIDSGFDKCQEIARELAHKYPQKIALVNSINPYRLHGQKTAAFEIWEELQSASDYLFIPVGNGGNITAYWMGYQQYREYRKSTTTVISSFYVYRHRSSYLPPLSEQEKDRFLDKKFLLPKMMGYQAAGAAPIVLGHLVENPQTVASAIRVGNPASWQGALKARDESGGKIDMVTDEEILVAYEMIPRLTGIFCEPASAASVAGLAKAILEYPDFNNSINTVIVCVLTGNGLKDSDSAKKFLMKKHSSVVPPDLTEVMKRLKL